MYADVHIIVVVWHSYNWLNTVEMFLVHAFCKHLAALQTELGGMQIYTHSSSMSSQRNFEGRMGKVFRRNLQRANFLDRHAVVPLLSTLPYFLLGTGIAYGRLPEMLLQIYERRENKLLRMMYRIIRYGF